MFTSHEKGRERKGKREGGREEEQLTELRVGVGEGEREREEGGMRLIPC